MPKNSQPGVAGGGGRDEHHLYDDLSRLNNELATAHRELAKKNAELERLNSQKNQFLGIAAHDLRNPLDVILSYSRFLLEDADAENLSAQQIEFLNVIRSSSRFMLNIVNDFLDYSKIEADKLRLDTEPVDLPKLLEKVVGRNRVLAAQKKIRLVLETNDARLPTPLVLDESKIEQVLNNLIGNAVKFSPANDIIYIAVLTRGSEVIISVKDNGQGVSPEEKNALFAPFEKGKSGGRGTAGEKGGAGLGLAIAKKIIEGHGGKITVESEAGAGAAFFVSLPIDNSGGGGGGNR